MDNLKEIIKEKRPNLSKTSLNTYSSTLYNLHKRIFPDEEFNIESFNKTPQILEYLKDKEPNKRKSILASLVVISDQKPYRDLMLEDIKEYNKEVAKQRKSSKQEDSWITQEEVNNRYRALETRWKMLYKKYDLTPTTKLHLTAKEIQEMQDYVILSLLGGSHIPPRRLKDYVDFRIRPTPIDDKDKINYRIRNKLYFNSYKTAKTYGQQVIKMPQKLIDIMNKWLEINPTFYLFIDTKGRPLSNITLNQRINKIFGKKVSVNQLRHTYLTHKYPDRIKDNEDLANDFKGMGSSMLQEKVYIKFDQDTNNNEVQD